MARIRTIKPEYWADHRVAAELTRDQRLFYIGLWNEADDEGRFLAHPRRLLGVLFPYDRDLTEAFIEGSLRTLADTGRVVLYEVNGEPYGQLTKFSEHQRINRPTPSKIPAPPTADGDSLRTHGDITEDAVPEQGKEQGTGKGKEQEAACETDATSVVRAANEGMKANPEIGERFNPIQAAGGGREIVKEWFAAGVRPTTAVRICRETAQNYKPKARHRQISSMSYFTSAVLEAHEREQIDGSGNGAGESGGGDAVGKSGRPSKYGHLIVHSAGDDEAASA